MQPGDLFISANGQAIDSMEKLQSITSENIGKTVTYVLQRGDQTLTMNVVPRTQSTGGTGSIGRHPGQPDPSGQSGYSFVSRRLCCLPKRASHPVAAGPHDPWTGHPAGRAVGRL